MFNVLRINGSFYLTLRLSAFLLMTIFMSISCKKGVFPGGNNTNITFFGGPDDHDIVSMISTTDGGYLVCGDKVVTSNNKVPFLMKFDATGHKQWSNSYPTMNGCSAVLQTPDGGYAMQGISDTSLTTITVLKTDAVGKFQWEVDYYDYYDITPYALCADNNGNYYVSGQIDDNMGPTYKMYVFKINANEQVSWFKTYNNPQPASRYYPANAIIDAQGMLVLEVIGNGGEQILKMDSSGKLIAQHTLNRLTSDTTYLQNTSLIQNQDGSYQATFDQTTNNSRPGHPVLQFYYHNLYSVQISNDFKQKTLVHLDSIYNINLNTTTLTAGTRMNIPFIQEANGNLFEAVPLISYNGYSQVQGQFAFILKNPQGKAILNKTLPGWPGNVIQDKTGNYFICGLSLNPDSDTRCVFAMYVDANGNNLN